MRFADYFGRAFSAVNAAQFPWIKMLRESTVAKMVDVSLEFSVFVNVSARYDFYMVKHKIKTVHVCISLYMSSFVPLFIKCM